MSQAVRHLFRAPDFRLFWLATGFSAFANQFLAVSLPWLVLQLSGSALALGSVLMTAAVPRTLLIIPGGALSDRLPPARVLLLALVARAAIFMAIAWPVSRGTAQLWLLYPFALVIGVLDAMAAPAAATMVPRVAGALHLTTGNSVMQGTAQAVGLVASFLAGLLIATAGVGAALGIGAVVLAAAAALMALIAREGGDRRGALAATPQPGDRRPAGASTSDVMRAFWRDPALRAFLLLIAALSLATTGPIAVGVPSLGRRFGGSVQFGLLLAAAATGTLAGTLLAGRFRRVRHRGILVLIVTAIIGLLLCALGRVPSLPWAMAVIGVMALASGFVNVVAAVSLQNRAGPAVLGRLMSTLMLASVGPTPLSFLLAGAAGDVDPGFLFVAAGAFVLLASAVAAFSGPLRQVD